MTKLDDIRKLIAEGESESVEWKKSTAALRDVGKTLSAFLNTTGGAVLIGVGPDGSLVGQNVTDTTQREIASMIARIDPHYPVEVSFVPVERGKVVVLRVGRGARRPYAYEGRAFGRIGSTNHVLSASEVTHTVLEANQAESRWEAEVAEGFSITDLDEEEILRTVRAGIERKRIPEVASREPIERILERLEVVRAGAVLNAAVALYATRPGLDFLQCELRAARFKGRDKAEFLDQAEWRAHAFKLLDEALLFCGRHLPLAGRIPPGEIRRKDTPLYPTEALREAIVNALIHRDYTLRGSSIDLAIFDDRLEVWSPGALPAGVRVQELKGPHKSERRNRLIAEAFFRAGLVEKWGRGTQRIVELCLDAGYPEPEFREMTGAFIVTFYSGRAGRIVEASGLSELQQEVLAVLSRDEAIAFRTIQLRLTSPVAKSTLTDALRALTEQGLIERLGKGRGIRYRVSR